MRRRVVEAVRDGEAPVEFLIGRCVEVWSRDGVNPLSAFSDFSRARNAYAAQIGITSHDLSAGQSAGAPWSVEFLMSIDQGEQVASRLARAGVSVDDLPALRKSAQRRIEETSMERAGR